MGRSVGKASQVQFLPAGDGIEHLPHKSRVGGGQSAEQRQARLAFFQQHPFCARTLLARQGALDTLAQRLQSFQPLLRGHELSVGDRIRRAGQQISQTDR